jgi:hypothetical protein
MAKESCPMCGNTIEPHDFGGASPMGTVCGMCWAKGQYPPVRAILIECVENPSRQSNLPDLLAIALPRG